MMLVLITYDVSVTDQDGAKRLRNIAKICLDHGMRVQNSVFECNVDMTQFVNLKAKLIKVFNPEVDSLRFYFLGKNGRSKIEHIGAKYVADPIREVLIL